VSMGPRSPIQREALFRVNQASEVEIHPHAKGCTLRWSDSRVASGILTNLPIIIISSVFILFGLGASLAGAVNMVMQDESDPCSFLSGDSIMLGEGAVYCEEEPYITELSSFEVDEQRFRLTNTDGDTVQLRWSEEGQYIVVGIYEQETTSSGFYSCTVHLDAASLPENWTVDDLVDPYAYNIAPDWCYQEFGSDEQEGNFSPVDVSPFENTTLWVVESDDAGFFCGVRFELESMKDGCYMLPYNDGLFITVMFPLVFAGVGLYMLSFSDDRRHQLTFHTSSQSLRWRKSFGGSSWTGSTWKRVDFEALEVVNITSNMYLGDDGQSSVHGRQLQLTVEGEEVPLLFVRHKQQDDTAFAAIVAQLESSLGVTVQRLDDPIQLEDDGLSVGDDLDVDPSSSDAYISREALLAAIHSTKNDLGSQSAESSSDPAPDIRPESSSPNNGQSSQEATGSNASFWGGMDGDEDQGK
jgi:hypothetical protein